MLNVTYDVTYPVTLAAELGSKPELQTNLTSTVVEDPCECIVIDVAIAGHQARTLVDSGAMHVLFLLPFVPSLVFVITARVIGSPL
jgi:hypothetical protein